MTVARDDRITPLKNDHKEIARQLDILRKAMAQSPRPSSRELGRAARRLASLIQRHLENEESTVYKPLSLTMGRHSPTDMMAREHRSIRQGLARLASALGEQEVNDARIEESRSRLASLQEQISAHMETEEKVLFWLADLKL